jgi:hypothetical protein
VSIEVFYQVIIARNGFVSLPKRTPGFFEE